MTLGCRLKVERDQGRLNRRMSVSVDELSVYSCFQNNGAQH